MPDDQRIRRLLEQIADSGRSAEDVCRGEPELLPEVRERLRRMRAIEEQVEAMFPVGSSGGSALSGLGLPAPIPRIPGYEIERVLGSGGMGVVYKARHLRLGRPVAIKMLLAGAFATPQELACLLREAQAVAGLRHPHIVQVYDVGDLDGMPYFTMEFMEGGNLATRLAGVPQPAREAAELVATVADAVEAAHRGGIVHRDLKPANILVGADGTLKIGDFSLARRAESDPSITLSSPRVGTPSYMAPEQAVGRTEAFCPSVDIYALGALLYDVLTGRPPFRAETSEETRRQVISEEPAPPSRLNAKVPRDLETICLKSLEKDPRRRYATAAAMRDDLRRFLNGEPIAARRAGMFERIFKWARRRPAYAVGIGAAVILTLALVGGATWIGSQRAAAAHAVREDLAAIAVLEQRSEWDRARNLLERGKTRLSAGGPAALRARLEAVQRDLDLVDRLDKVRLDRIAASSTDFGRPAGDQAYEDAFVDAGIGGPSEAPDKAAARVAASPVRAALLAALDDWAFCTRDLGRLQWVLATALFADPDPQWRDRARNPRAWASAAGLAALAAGADASREPVPLLLVVAGLLHEKGGDGLSLYRRVQAANPGDFFANFNLAECLDEMGDDDAIGFYRAALAVRPKAVAAHVNLGIAFVRRQRTEEAVACWRRALEIDPNVPLANLNLALAALGRNDFEEAAGFARKAAELEPRSAMNNAVLGRALLGAARFEEARGYIETALELYDPKDPQRPLAVMDLQTCLRQIEFGPRVAEYRARTDRLATARESLEIADLLLDRAEYALAARYFADAMEQDPSLAHDLSAGTRYNAACAAALAGTPRDHGGPIPPAEQAASRDRARRWLREDLEAWTQALGSGGAEMPKYIVQYVGHWLNDRDIAPIREEAALAALPAAEQEEARALWRDVAALVERAKTAP